MIPVYHWRADVSYEEACRRQEKYIEEKREALIFCEHPPTVTLGTSAEQTDLLVTPEKYQQKGITIHKSPRGGKTTYHGPGQLVCYPIINIRERDITIHGFLRILEETVINLCVMYGINAQQVEGKTGIWVDERKIGFIGIRIRRGFTFHGLSLNVKPQHDPFQTIVPCGMPNLHVTSLEEETGNEQDLWFVGKRLKEILEQRFSVNTVESPVFS